jgi:hypothetical protein
MQDPSRREKKPLFTYNNGNYSSASTVISVLVLGCNPASQQPLLLDSHTKTGQTMFM